MSEEPEDILDGEQAELSLVAQMLRDERMLPSAGFRGELARLLATLPMPWSGRRLWPTAIALASAGCLLLCLVGLGVLGSGPFAP